MKVFWNSFTKTKLENIQKKTYAVEFPLNTNAQIQSIAYYRMKNSTTDKFRKVLRKKKMF